MAPSAHRAHTRTGAARGSALRAEQLAHHPIERPVISECRFDGGEYLLPIAKLRARRVIHPKLREIDNTVVAVFPLDRDPSGFLNVL